MNDRFLYWDGALVNQILYRLHRKGESNSEARSTSEADSGDFRLVHRPLNYCPRYRSEGGEDKNG